MDPSKATTSEEEPAQQLITLVSSDQVEFKVTLQEANVSKMISRMLQSSSNFMEAQKQRVQLPTVSSEILQVIVRVSCGLLSFDSRRVLFKRMFLVCFAY